MGLLGSPSYAHTDIGEGGRTLSGILAAGYAAMDTSKTDYIVVNIGVNDIAQGQNVEATWKANYLTLIDALHTLVPTAKLWLAKPWYRGHDAECSQMAGWIDDIVAARPGVAFIGHNENVWLKGADDGATMTSDGTHYSAAGMTEHAAQWKAIIQP
jgi:lysophospholipase L1-like esterase